MNTDAIVTSSSMELLQVGVAGVFCLFLIGCLWLMWKKVERKDAELVAKNAELNAEKDARLKDVQDFVDDITPLLKDLKDTAVRQTQVSEKTYESILSSNRGA